MAERCGKWSFSARGATVVATCSELTRCGRTRREGHIDTIRPVSTPVAIFDAVGPVSTARGPRRQALVSMRRGRYQRGATGIDVVQLVTTRCGWHRRRAAI